MRKLDNIDEVKEELSNRVYQAAIAVLEANEDLLTGNAHHKAQDIAEFAKRVLNEE